MDEPDVNPAVAARRERCKRSSGLLGLLVTAVGGMVLAGWVLDIDGLERLHPSLVTMKANTSVCFILVGLSLRLQGGASASSMRVRGAQVLATLAAVIGGLSFLEHVLNFDAGIDQLLFRETIESAGRSVPGRMAPASGLNFLLLGTALVLLRRVGGYRAVATLTFVAATVTLLAFIIYFYGAAAVHEMPIMATIALHTVLTFLTVCAAILLARPNEGVIAVMTRDTSGSVLARRLLPTAVLLPVLFGWIALAGSRAGWFTLPVGIAGFAVVLVTIFAGLSWNAASTVDRLDAEVRRADAQHKAELEATVKERTAKLQEMVGELEAFSYSISHDMRAPLRAMSSYSSIVMEEYGGKMGPDGAALLEKIKQASGRLDRLITDVLAYSRVVRAEMKLQPVDANRLIHDLLEQYPQWQPPKAFIKIEGKIHAVMANEALLSQCVTNLIGNAVKFVGPKTTPEVRIWSETNEAREAVKILFRDNGIGIDPADQGRIFKVFERVHGPEYEGTGIGLSIVRKAVERMGGKLGLESQAGKGSTFWIELRKAG